MLKHIFIVLLALTPLLAYGSSAIDFGNTGVGTVSAPGTVTDNAAAAYDGTDGKLLQDTNLKFLTPDWHLDGNAQFFMNDGYGVFWNYGSAHYGIGLNISGFSPTGLSGNVVKINTHDGVNNGFAIGTGNGGTTLFTVAGATGLVRVFNDLQVDDDLVVTGDTTLKSSLNGLLVATAGVVASASASDVPFNPSDPGDWSGPPNNLQAALDELGGRSSGGGGACTNWVTGAMTRVTDLPNAAGEYRSLYKGTNSANITSWTDTSPFTAPSAANGLRIYADPYDDAGSSGEPNAYYIFVGVDKEISLRMYESTGRTGIVFGANSGGYQTVGSVSYGLRFFYDPTTGVALVTGGQHDTTITSGSYFSQDPEGNFLTDGYFDICVR